MRGTIVREMECYYVDGMGRVSEWIVTSQSSALPFPSSLNLSHHVNKSFLFPDHPTEDQDKCISDWKQVQLKMVL